MLSPAVQDGDTIYLHGTRSTESIENEDFIFLSTESTLVSRFASWLSARSKFKIIWYLLNLYYLIFKGSDLHYPVSALNAFFTSHALGKDDLLIASGPPFSLFKAAASLAAKFKCKLVLDYRDPWTYGYAPIDSRLFIDKLKTLAGRSQEDKALKIAAFVNCDSASVKALFPKRFQEKVNVILNGANLSAIKTDKIVDYCEVFRIVYLGTIYYDQLEDETFFACARDFIQRNVVVPGKFEIVFVGASKNIKLPILIKKYNLEPYTIITHRMDIEKAMDIACTASVFLHLRYGTNTEVDTSKHLDYLALQKWILLPVTDHGNVASSIISNKAGYVCNNTKECMTALEDLWAIFETGGGFRIKRDQEFLYNISREAEAAKLVEIVRQHVLKEEADVATGLLK